MYLGVGCGTRRCVHTRGGSWWCPSQGIHTLKVHVGMGSKVATNQLQIKKSISFKCYTEVLILLCSTNTTTKAQLIPHTHCFPSPLYNLPQANPILICACTLTACILSTFAVILQHLHNNNPPPPRKHR